MYVYIKNEKIRWKEKKLTAYAARMKNVTGVRRNGVLYGWRLRPRINHFTLCTTTLLRLPPIPRDIC